MRKALGIIGGLATLAIMGGSAMAATTPSGALAAQPEGTLSIQQVTSGTHKGQYEAIWTWSGLQPNQEVMLIGSPGTSVSFTNEETLDFGQTSPNGGTVTIYFSDYNASPSHPETFEAFALFSSVPTGQLPEAPYAAGLPLAALALGGVVWYRLRRA